MFEEDQVFERGRLGEKRPLECQRLHRIQVVTHDPRQRHVRGRRDQIRHEDGRLSARLDPHELMMRSVAASADRSHARHDLRIVVHERELARCRDGCEVVGGIARAIPFVRMLRILPLAAADDVAGVREARAHDAVGAARR